MFETLVSPEHRKMTSHMKQKKIGMDSRKEEQLKILIEYENELSSNKPSSRREKLHAGEIRRETEQDHKADGFVSKRPHMNRKKLNPKEVLEELDQDPETALVNNLHLFEEKFKVVESAISKAMQREGDRIINAVTRGPGDRLTDRVRICILKRIAYLRIYRISARSGKKWFVIASLLFSFIMLHLILRAGGEMLK
jgi:hypothetical protein